MKPTMRSVGRRRPISKPQRVFIGLTEISGYASALRDGLRSVGVHAEFLDLNPAVYRFGADAPPTLLMRWLQDASRRRAATPRSAVARKILHKGVQILLTPLVLAQALARYDVFVFLYDSTFLNYRELRLLRALGKQVVYVFCGSDIRPDYMDGALSATARGASIDDCIASVRRKKRMLAIIERHATHIVAHPPFAQLLRRRFVSFLAIGLPRRHPQGQPGVNCPSDPTPVIVHAPTNPTAKGTAVIRDVVTELEQRGHRLRYEELEGIPYVELLSHLRRATLVVDMVWSDTPMAGLAADAAHFGVPTIVGGYAWDDLQRLTKEPLPPSLCCAPDEVADAITSLLADEERRNQLGQAARDFVRNVWSADDVARRFLRLFEGDIPETWWCDPAEIRYALGWGQSRARSCELVSAVLKRGGRTALGVDDKPALEKRLVELANGVDGAAAVGA